MIQGTSLINQIPIPNSAPKTEMSVPAAVSVADVVGGEEVDTRNFLQKFISNQIEKYAQKRMERLENTPVEQLSDIEKAELEANKSVNYNA